ncbi:Eco57I restriction-modification methylase domain-containing protein [Halalkalicoccus ordinarius]|uniref:Eco57I restriction-modification methylase domain-containing protein n=1 Tax=Halalkalicoccus ordinarius TaxID=3116651 RepID=UPI00300F652F
MSQAASPSDTYLNSNLFSGYYLDERVADLDAWDCDDEAQAALSQLQEAYNQEGGLLPSYKEEDVLSKWIDEVLDVLGFDSLSETNVTAGRGEIDRTLFASSQDRIDAAHLRQDGDLDGMYSKSVALLEAKKWNTDFSTRFNEGRQYRDASHQIKFYLERTPEDVKWGILTDGRKWRLYGTKDYETQTYYEIDLPELLESGRVEQFKYFYVFFRAAAFEEIGGSTFLDEVWNESETAAQELGEDLQDNVFTALRVLGEGFVEKNDLWIDPDDDAALDELKEQSLVLLYRLMFILYAESRGLIDPDTPRAEDEYQSNFSLEALRDEILEEIDNARGFDEVYSSYSTTMWSRMEDLFRLIDSGEQELGIPAYNGGLFDHDQHAFLTENEVSNRHLAEVIYRLSTTQADDGSYVPADYADLDTRHLGTIYEGLLEHEFRIAPEEYAAVSEDGGQVWKPATEVTVADAVESVEKGELYVVNDEGERKATGAYYTPDYVVTYIVEETIDPLLEDIEEDLREEGLNSGTEAYVYAFADRVLELKVLDPAMGSGHFLTKATGYLADAVMQEVRKVEKVAGVFDEQDVRRRVSKECIYGVDLNGMAVELAKLSMWLETLAADQPLAFLDHHLKEGNSLIGSDISEVLSGDTGDSGGQLTLHQAFARVRQNALDHVMDLVQELLSYDNDTLEDIKSMEALHAEIRSDPLYERLFEIANVHTAEQFGVDIPEGSYERMAEALRNESWIEIEEQAWFRSAQAMAEEEQFFHWELEFPVAFYAEDGKQKTDAGFDALIGNPPYVRMEKFKKAKKYLTAEFDTHAARTDLYVYFIEQSVRILRKDGLYGAIVSNKFLRSNYGKNVRSLLGSQTAIHEIIDFGGLPVFPDATVRSAIVISQKNPKSGKNPLFAPIDNLEFELLSSKVNQVGYEIDSENLQGEEWRLVSHEISELMGKIEAQGKPLIKCVNGQQIGRGIVTGLNNAFFIDESKRNSLIEKDPKSAEIIRPIARGRDIRSYYVKDNPSYLLYMNHGVNIDKYPAIENHLKEYKEALEGRATEQNWYELQQPQQAYIEHFEGAKILYPVIAPENRFAFHTGPLYLNDKCFFIPTEDRYLVGILNSTLCLFYLQQVLAKLEGANQDDIYYEFRSQYMEQLPIKQPQEDREKIAEMTEDIHKLHRERAQLNLSLLDYLGNYTEGLVLPDIGFFQPTSSSILDATTEDYKKLRVGDVRTKRDGCRVTIYARARYKPENEDEYETDRWGYTETDYLEAFTLANLSEEEAAMIEVFVPVAVNEADGFAGFRDNATKTNSPIDRLKAITLPDSDDITHDLQRYLKAKERSEELNEKIEKIDRLIDDIVFDLYNLTEEEIEIVEEYVS